MLTDPGTTQIAPRHMNVEIGAEAALFPGKECIYGIFVAVLVIDSRRGSQRPPESTVCLKGLSYYEID
jgi:hypothetical protein